ncbi:hypothetical protein MNBD_GAMMA03-1916 [hydrothermal vent metagenome]|uniref:Uncharacterized protein n=1 Tax=hydrothermal vent metagenome TaxID=652676 RepID=A0A3B0WE47_9ZZZZ
MLRLFLSCFLVLFYLYFLLFGYDIIQLILQSVVFGLLMLLIIGFVWSLIGNNTPVITRYALLMGAEDSSAERRYTRKVTLVWVFFLMSLLFYKVCFFLGVIEIGGRGFLEIGFYLGSAALFVGEFYLRPFFLPSHKGSAFVPFLIGLGQVSFKALWQFDRNN